MPKLKKEEAQKRESFALEIFKKNPKLSVAKANAEVKSKFGSHIRAIKMYELRKKAGSGKSDSPALISSAARPSKRPLTVAARQPGQELNVLPMVVSIEGLDPAAAVAATLEKLRGAGLTNLQVDAQKERWVVIDVAS